MIGTEIHNYRITEKIGEGGMATVYKAVHKSMPNLVRAVKVLHPVLSLDAGIKAKFVNEASAMASLDHPNIVKIFDYEEVNGNLFLMMEYLDGTNLEDLIRHKTGPIPEARVVKIFSKVLDAIGYAHSRGIIHRDIKPSNIIIGPSDEPKIIDFGIVKILEDENNPGKTKTGTKIGTPLYMSPEQILAKGVDRRSDIYGLGVTLFQMITGRAPYPNTISEFEILTKIVNEPLPRVREMYPAASERMQILIDKATAKNKEDRYSSCEEFKNELNGAATAPNLQDTRPVTVKIPEHKIPAVVPPNPKKNNAALWFFVIILFLGLTGYGIYKFSATSERASGNEEMAATTATVTTAPAPEPKAERRDAENRSSDFDIQRIKSQVSGYYTMSCSVNNFNDLEGFLDPNIPRFYDYYNRSLADIKQNRIKYCNRWLDRSVNIDWNSFRYRESDGLLVVNFRQKYSIRRFDLDHYNYYDIQTQIKFNRDYKMVYIADERTDKVN